jgi:hypothetical protein
MSSDEFVYILSNISYPDDLFKIGSSRVSPSNRAYQLQSSGVPTSYPIYRRIRYSGAWINIFIGILFNADD